MREWGFENVHVTGSLRFSFRHPTGSLYSNYGYFMRGWEFEEDWVMELMGQMGLMGSYRKM